jgi:hypothetical protein
MKTSLIGYLCPKGDNVNDIRQKPIILKVNGRRREVVVSPSRTLLDVLPMIWALWELRVL